MTICKYIQHMLTGSQDNKAVHASSTTVAEAKLFDYLVRNPYEFNPNIPKTSWDFDWDKRDPASLVPPDKSPLDGDIKGSNKQSSPARGTATRHLLLIRHGQYNLKGITDSEKTLTPLVTIQLSLHNIFSLSLQEYIYIEFVHLSEKVELT